MPKNNWINTAASLITGKKAMSNCVRQAIFSITGKKAQEIPGWAYIIAIIIGLILLVVLLWIAAKSGKVGIEQITEIR